MSYSDIQNRNLHLQSASLDHAGPDGKWVLQCATQLHSNHILRSIAPEVWRGQQPLYLDCMIQVLGRYYHLTYK